MYLPFSHSTRSNISTEFVSWKVTSLLHPHRGDSPITHPSYSLICSQKTDIGAWWETEDCQEYIRHHFSIKNIAKYFRTRSPVVSAADIDGWCARRTGVISRQSESGVCVYYCSTYYKSLRVGGRGIVEDMCYERRRAEACVD